MLFPANALHSPIIIRIKSAKRIYTDCKLAESKTTIERKINIGNVLELNEVRDPPLGAGQIHVVSQRITVSRAMEGGS